MACPTGQITGLWPNSSAQVAGKWCLFSVTKKGKGFGRQLVIAIKQSRKAFCLGGISTQKSSLQERVLKFIDELLKAFTSFQMASHFILPTFL